MGPMMGGWSAGNISLGEWLLATLVLLVLVAVIGIALWRAGGTSREHQPRSPEETLHDRFARGELSREQYREALVDLLRGRYVRGEIDLDAYEARVARVFGNERPRSQPLTEDRDRVGATDDSGRRGSGYTVGGPR